MYILSDLWNGTLDPTERHAHRDSEYRKLAGETNDCMERLMEELTPKGAELLEKFVDKNLQLFSVSEECTFIRGVRIGAQFILDVKIGRAHV